MLSIALRSQTNKIPNFNYVVDEILQTTLAPPTVCASVLKSNANADDFMMVLNSHRNRDQIVLTDDPGYFFGEIPEKE